MADGLFEKVAFGGVVDLADERPIVLLRAELIEEGFRVDAEHRQALQRVADARRELDNLRRRDDGLVEALRSGGPFGDGQYEPRDAEDLRAEREELRPKIDAALAEVKEAEAEEEALRDSLSRDFVAVEIGRYKPAKPEDR